ncbi:methyltransferase regulatory domain-containing protein [Pseudoxanthomonas sp. 10H]|uniref:methyltransferase regulatory domain-containing protein n=1 Tax=Pseudoxanthomonas sp. 10H TaxID=3242729 RepID=UPI003557A036
MNQHNEQLRAHYEAAPYASHAYFHASPEHIAATAMLLGAEPPPPETARVLEIGCSSGGNIIPFALRNPRAQAVGFDLSGSHIRRGQQAVAALGLRNMSLREDDLASVTREEYGEFDYIVCHGVLSWIPDAARAEAWRVCRSLLAPNGIAYISYNTYPGWKAKEIMRDAMLLHARDQADAAGKLTYARSMVGYLRHVAPADSLLRKVVEDNIYILSRTGADYLAHDYLEPFNRPFYLRDFVDEAGAASMRYLGEADLGRMFPEGYAADVVAPLQDLASDPVMLGQYLDFAVNRSFRQSLLFRDGGVAAPGYRRGDGSRLSRLHLSAQLPCRDGAVRLDGSTQAFGVEGGVSLQLRHPLAKLAAQEIDRAWPGTIAHSALVQAVAAHGAAGGDERLAATVVNEIVEFLVIRGLARYRLEPVALRPTWGEAPMVDACVRASLAAGAEEQVVTSRWHEGVDIDALDRALYPHLDGRTGIDALQRTWQRLQDETGAPGDGSTLEARLDAAARRGLLAG